MIKSESARRGNLVEYEGRIFEIDSISEDFPTLNTSEFGIGVVDWNNVNPIPLTEEWLVNKFGGQPGIIELKHCTARIVELHGLKFEISTSGNVYLYRQNKHIPWIHKLQNLIYELKDVKLKIKENGKR